MADLDLDVLMDGILTSYSCRRIIVLALLGAVWLTQSFVFIDVFAARKMDVSSCACLRDGSSIGNVSTLTNYSSLGACGACAALGGSVACPADHDPTTLESDFHLICGSEWLSGLLPSCVFIGIGIGGGAGAVSDRIGRRPTLLVASSLLALAMPLSASAQSFGTYMMYKVLCGIGGSGMTQAGFTLASELVGATHRTRLTVELWSYFWATMSCSVPLLALALREDPWRVLLVAASVPNPLLLVATYLLVPESPRWLLQRGRREEACAVLASLGMGEGRLLDADSAGAHLDAPLSIASQATDAAAANASDAAVSSGMSALRDLLCTPGCRVVTFVMLILWTTCSLSYYAIAFSAAALSGSPEINFLLVSLPLFPCSYIGARFMDHPAIGRRLATAVFLATVVIGLGLAVLWPAVAVYVSMLANFAANAVFNLIFVQVPELYPTEARNTALGLCSASARVSTLFSGLLPRLLGPRPTQALIAVMCTLCAVLAWLVVPETVGRGLPETLPRPRWRKAPGRDQDMRAAEMMTASTPAGAMRGAVVPAPAVRGFPISVNPINDASTARASHSASAARRAVDLVDLSLVDGTLMFDIKYARTDNFMERVLYPSARALLQRPAAEALARVQVGLSTRGLGLVVYDAYRPASVTRAMWEETPPEQRHFVADPAIGSKHNRGCAVDVTLCELRFGSPLPMPSAFDEFTERAYSDYDGGTVEERANRAALREAMACEGFAVNPREWWHFDHCLWAEYPVMDVPLEERV